MVTDRTLRGAGQRCLGLAGVNHADVTEHGLELVLSERWDTVPPSVLAVLAGSGVGVANVARQGDATIAICR